MKERYIFIKATLVLDAKLFPPDDDVSEDWLIHDVLMGGEFQSLHLMSEEIGDFVGELIVESLEYANGASNALVQS